MSLPPITAEELVNTVDQLRDSSPGHDGIPIMIIRKVLTCILPVLLHLCNTSFSTGVFPDQLKIAKVVPIYKAGDKTLYSNHRPISILPAISKLLEKIMYKRVIQFCTNNNIITKDQYGFQSGKSTETALTSYSRDILSAFDDQLYTISVFLDLSKAFDTVDHNILLKKLDHYGMRDNVYKWFQSYLSDRQQFVVYKKSKSDKQIISFGMPQGGTMGPLLFILYVNDLVNSNRLFNSILFADDTTLYASHSNLNTLVHLVNTELNNVHSWMIANKLTLNIDKTKYIIHHRKKKRPPDIDAIKIGNVNITEVENIKFLGVIVDKELKWNSHILNIKNKISKQCGILYLVRNCFSRDVLKQLYYTLIYPYLTYCHTVWATAGITKINKVELVQKRVIRTITYKRKFDHTHPLFKSLRLLKWEDVNVYFTAVFVYKTINNLNSLQLFNFRLNERYNLRYSNDLVIPALASAQSQKSVAYHGVTIWNALPVHIRERPSLSTFKIALKCHLLSKY